MVHTSKQTSATAHRPGLAQLLTPRLFRALGDPRRVALLIRLAEAGVPCTVGDLARGGGVDLSVVSRHLSILREAGIIECVRQGKQVWCTVQTGTLARILRDLADALETCCPAPAPEGRGSSAEVSRTRSGAAPRRSRS